MRIETTSRGGSISTDKTFVVFTKGAIQIITDKGYLLASPESLQRNGEKIASKTYKEENNLFLHWEHQIPVESFVLQMGVWYGKITESYCQYITIYPAESTEPVSLIELGQFAGTFHTDIEGEKLMERLLFKICREEERKDADYCE